MLESRSLSDFGIRNDSQVRRLVVDRATRTVTASASQYAATRPARGPGIVLLS